MQYPAFAAGQRLTAAGLLAAMPTLIVKSADQTVNNSTTLVDAADMTFTADANATYLVLLRASYTSNTTADIKFNWNQPSGASWQRYTLGAGTGIADGATLNLATVTLRRRSSTNSSVGGDSNTTQNFSDYYEDNILRTVSAGTVTLQFAQNTANASDTILRSDSYIQYKRIA